MGRPFQALTRRAGSLVRRGRNALGRRLIDLGGSLERAAQRRSMRAESPEVPPGRFDRAFQVLRDHGLLTPVETADWEKKWIVHRWTAGALARSTADQRLREAHRRAARFWRSRRGHLPENEPEDPVAELLEERFHRQRAGQLGLAFLVTDLVKKVLFRQGQYRRLGQLYREMLGWYPRGSYELGTIQQQLGNLAERTGDHDAARTWLRRALETFEELGDRHGMGRSHHNLGMMAQIRGDHDRAVVRYEKALEQFQATTRDPASIALCYHNLGAGHELQGNYDEALAWCRKALTVFEELGDGAGIARCHHQLGELARKRGDRHLAIVWHHSALGIFTRLGDRSGIARSSHHLGMMSQEMGLLQEATEHYRRAAEIAEELGDLSAMASVYHNLGSVAQQREALDDAQTWYRRSLAIEERLGNRHGIATTCQNLGMVAEAQGRADEARAWFEREAEHRESGDPGGDTSHLGG